MLIFAALIVLALLTLYHKGHWPLCAVLLPGCAALLYSARRDPMVGATLKWQAGEWFVEHAGSQVSVLISPGSVQFPGLVYVVFRESYAVQRWVFLLFNDSADADQLRQLRRRLILG